MSADQLLQRERDAVRSIALVLKQGGLEQARRAVEALGDGESVARRALTALIHACSWQGSQGEFETWRRRVADSDVYLNGFFGTELPALVPPEELTRTFQSNEMLVSVLERLVARLESEEGRLVAPPTIRARAVEILHALPMAGVDETSRSLDDLQSRHPRSVQVRCYRGELLLWLGRYREAWRSFSDASRIEPARWAEIGKVAVLALTGHLARAAAQSEVAERAFRPLPASTLPVYQGVLERRAGRLEEAIAHLGAALEEKPTRVGARIELCLALRAANRGSLAVSHVATVLREARPLLADAATALNIDWRGERERLVGSDVLEQALRAMRGNRSSALVTWFDGKGELRFLKRA